MTKKLSEAELKGILEKAVAVTPISERFRHIKSGNYYIVVLVSLRESDLEPLVHYAKPNYTGLLPWTRTQAEFLEKFMRA